MCARLIVPGFVKTTPRLLFLLAFSLIFSLACERTYDAELSAPQADSAPPRTSAWSTFHEKGSELKNFAMYTYVLFGRLPHPTADYDAETRERYTRILEEVTRSTMRDQWGNELPRDEVNLFSIPVSERDSEGRPTLEKYNFQLSLLYLDRVGGSLLADSEVAIRFLDEAGPFLVSTLKPIPKVKNGDRLLFANLSDTNPAAMGEVVIAYKRRVKRPQFKRYEAFEPFHLRLLDAVLDADDNVGLVTASISAWIK